MEAIIAAPPVPRPLTRDEIRSFMTQEGLSFSQPEDIAVYICRLSRLSREVGNPRDQFRGRTIMKILQQTQSLQIPAIGYLSGKILDEVLLRLRNPGRPPVKLEANLPESESQRVRDVKVREMALEQHRKAQAAAAGVKEAGAAVGAAGVQVAAGVAGAQVGVRAQAAAGVIGTSRAGAAAEGARAQGEAKTPAVVVAAPGKLVMEEEEAAKMEKQYEMDDEEMYDDYVGSSDDDDTAKAEVGVVYSDDEEDSDKDEGFSFDFMGDLTKLMDAKAAAGEALPSMEIDETEDTIPLSEAIKIRLPEDSELQAIIASFSPDVLKAAVPMRETQILAQRLRDPEAEMFQAYPGRLLSNLQANQAGKSGRNTDRYQTVLKMPDYESLHLIRPAPAIPDPHVQVPENWAPLRIKDGRLDTRRLLPDDSYIYQLFARVREHLCQPEVAKKYVIITRASPSRYHMTGNSMGIKENDNDDITLEPEPTYSEVYGVLWLFTTAFPEFMIMENSPRPGRKPTYSSYGWHLRNQDARIFLNGRMFDALEEAHRSGRELGQIFWIITVTIAHECAHWLGTMMHKMEVGDMYSTPRKLRYRLREREDPDSGDYKPANMDNGEMGDLIEWLLFGGCLFHPGGSNGAYDGPLEFESWDSYGKNIATIGPKVALLLFQTPPFRRLTTSQVRELQTLENILYPNEVKTIPQALDLQDSDVNIMDVDEELTGDKFGPNNMRAREDVWQNRRERIGDGIPPLHPHWMPLAEPEPEPPQPFTEKLCLMSQRSLPLAIESIIFLPEILVISLLLLESTIRKCVDIRVEHLGRLPLTVDYLPGSHLYESLLVFCVVFFVTFPIGGYLKFTTSIIKRVLKGLFDLFKSLIRRNQIKEEVENQEVENQIVA